MTPSPNIVLRFLLGLAVMYLQKRLVKGEALLDLYTWDRTTGEKIRVATDVLAAVWVQ